MSKQVDERVVSMQFDNRQFERNVSTTMSTLDKLKQRLNLSGATKGLENVNAAAKNVNMAGLGSAVDQVSAKFSALQVMGVTALANLTNSVVNSAKRMAKALTIEPVMTGFNEYETKINAIQTIMSNTASKGTTMEDVTKVIGELNTYADKTIYNFAEMTRNIGTFTAAGVGLEESAAAIQGIANLAAASGSNSQQASTAMYQLSQALAAGTVKLMDWNSVVNAGMGGEKFQEALKATAREHGIAVDSIIEKNGSFRDSLQDGWISADILNETLRKFTVEGAKEYADMMVKSGKYTQDQADALIKEAQAMEDAATKVKTFTQLWDTMKESVQSGWAQTWELVVGDFEEAKEFLSGLSEMFGGIIESFSNARNKLLGGALNSKWDELNSKIEAAGLSTDEFHNKIKEVAKENGINVDELIKNYGSLGAAIKNGKIPTDIVRKAIEQLIGTEEKATESAKELGNVVEEVISGKWGNGQKRWDALTEAGYNWVEVQNEVNKKYGAMIREVDGLTEAETKNIDALSKLSDEQLKSKGFTEEQIVALRELEKAADGSGSSIDELLDDITKPSGRELLLGSFMNILDGVIGSCKALGEAWREVFDPMTSDQLYGIIEGFNKLTSHLRITDEETGKINETGKKLARTFRGLFAALDIVLTVVGGPLKIAFEIFKQILGAFDMDILGFTAAVGDSIFKFRDWLDSVLDFTGLFKEIIPYVSDAISTIAKWFDRLRAGEYSPEQVAEAIIGGFKKAVKFIGDMVRTVRDMLLGEVKSLPSDFVEGFGNGILAKLGFVKDVLIELGKSILEYFRGVLGIHSPSTETHKDGENFVQGFINGITGFVSKAWDEIKSFGEKCIDVLRNIDFGSVFAGIMSAGILAAMFKISSALDKLASPFEGLGDMFESIAGAFDALKGTLKSFSTSIKAKAIKDIAIAIAILAASVIALSFVDPIKLMGAVVAIWSLAITLSAMAFAIGKFEAIGGIKIASFGVLMLSLGASLLMLVGVIKILEGVDWNNADNLLLGLVAIVGSLITLIAVYGKLVKGQSARNISKFGTMLLKLSVTFLLLAAVVKILSTIEWEQMKDAAVGIGGLTVVIAALVGLSWLAGKKINSIGKTILKIGITMALLVAVAKIISEMSWNDLYKAAAGIGGLAVIITGLVWATKLASDRDISKAGNLIAGIGAAMLMMTLTGKIIAGMSWNDLYKAAAGIVVLGGIIVGLVAATKLASDKELKRVGSTLLMMSVSIGILSLVAALLGFLNLEHLAKGVLAVTILGSMMALMIAATKNAQNVKGNIIAISIAIGVMAVAVAALSFIDTTKLAGATTCLTVLMGMFAIMAKSAGTMQKATGTIIAMGIILAIMAGALYLLSGLPIESAMAATIGLSILMLAFAASLKIMSGMTGPSGKALVAMGVMALVVAALAGVLYLLQGLNPTQAIGMVGAISAFLAVLLIALAAMTFLQAPSFLGLAALAIVTLVVAALAGVLYALQDVDPKQAIGIVGVITAFLLAMEVVCIAAAAVGALAGLAIPGLAILVGFIGALGLVVIGLAALAMDVISGMPQLGMDLSNFMTNVQPLIDGVQNIPDDIGDKIGKLCSAILKLTGTEILTAIGEFFSGGNSLSDLGNELKTFGSALGEFSGVSGNIDIAIAAIDKVKEISVTSDEYNLSGLTSFADDMSYCASKMATINVSSMLAVVSASRVVINFIRSLSSLDFGGVTNFKSAMAQLGETSLDGFVSAFTNATAVLSTAGSNMIRSIVSGIQASRGLLTASSTVIALQTIRIFTETAPKFTVVGQAFVTNLRSGMIKSMTMVSAAGKTIANSAVNGARTAYSGFYSAGSYCVTGFVNGISWNTYKATNAGYALGKAALNAAKAALREASPSKAFYEVADYGVIGFVNAFHDGLGDSEKAGADVANSALSGLSNAMSQIKDAVDSEIDANPTIRPVLDLSNIQNGANSIGGMFAQQTVALAGINADYARVNAPVGLADLISQLKIDNDTSNKEVVDAITNLRGDFGSLVSAISGLHIRMDSGTVVGELIGKIDNSLGQIASYKGRGN